MIMQIEKKKLADLNPAPYNPRTITDAALEGLKASMTRFGCVELIVWNKRTGHIVSGHQRYRVLEAEGITETDVVIVDLEETEEKALNVAMNNPHIAGEFTEDLQIILSDIKVELGIDTFIDLHFEDLIIPVLRN